MFRSRKIFTSVSVFKQLRSSVLVCCVSLCAGLCFKPTNLATIYCFTAQAHVKTMIFLKTSTFVCSRSARQWCCTAVFQQGITKSRGNILPSWKISMTLWNWLPHCLFVCFSQLHGRQREFRIEWRVTACRKRQRWSSSLSNLRSNRVNDVTSLLFADSAMCSGVIWDQSKPKDGPETTHAPCKTKKNLFTAQVCLISEPAVGHSHHLHCILLFGMFFTITFVMTFVISVFECLLAHHIYRRQLASPKSGRCNRWVAVQRKPRSWTPARIWWWDESAPGAEPSGPTLPSWQGRSHPWGKHSETLSDGGRWMESG